MKINTLLVCAMLLLPFETKSQSLVFTDEEQRAYEENKTEMVVPVEFLAGDAFAAIQADYKVNPYDTKTIRRLCVRMETHKYIHNYILETAQQRIRHKRDIEIQYWDSIAAYLIPVNPEMTGRFVGYAISMSKELDLTDETNAILMQEGIRLFQWLRVNPCVNLAREEMDTLKSVLNPEQIEKVIHRRNKTEVDNRVQSIWETLANAELIEELDKDAEQKRAETYIQKELFIRDYYIGDHSLISANLDDLYRHKPTVINMYEGLLQKESIKKKYEEKVGFEYSW